MEIQHCVQLTLTSNLSFVHARCSQKHLPYTFEAKEGGVFSTESAYGCVQLTHFSIWSIIYKMLVPGVQLYSASVYYLRKEVNRIDIHFAITKNLEAHATVSSKSPCSLFIAVICWVFEYFNRLLNKITLQRGPHLKQKCNLSLYQIASHSNCLLRRLSMVDGKLLHCVTLG